MYNNIIILLFIINVLSYTAAERSFNFFKRNDNYEICFELNNKNENGEKKDFILETHSYSLIDGKAISFFKNCYWNPNNDIIVCNDNLYHYNYIFYLPVNSHQQDQNMCNHNNTDIKNWDLINSTSQDKNVFVYTQDVKNYTFELQFENNCLYTLPIQKVQYIKSFATYSCQSHKVIKH